MNFKCLIKIASVIGLLLISFSITPAGGQNRGGNFFVQQIDWLKRWPEFKNLGTPVIINPRMLYLGVLLGLIGILCG
jgi:hypothetical protein